MGTICRELRENSLTDQDALWNAELDDFLTAPVQKQNLWG